MRRWMLPCRHRLVPARLRKPRPRGGAPQPELLFAIDNLRAIAGWLRAARPRRLHRRRRRRRDGHRAPADGEELLAGVAARLQATTRCCASRRSRPTSGASSSSSWCSGPTTRCTSTCRRRTAACRRRFVSIPSKSLVVPLERGEAELRFRREVLLLEGPERDALMEAERLNQIASLLIGPAGAVGRAAEVSLTSKASRSG